MRIRTSAALLVASIAAATAVPRAADGPPRLAVIIVVDQMRADYIDRFAKDWTGGLKRLSTEGARFTNAAYPYLTTVTCAGHATIGTGALPPTHGIFQNVWYERDTGRLTPCTDDATVTSVSYGAGGSNGDGPGRLMVPTLGDEMRRQRSAKVVTLALKARSAIMLAGHGGDAVTWISETLETWQTSTAYTRKQVGAVQEYVNTHPIGADYGRTWERLLPAERYPEADGGLGETFPRGWGPLFPHPLRGAGGDKPDTAFYDQWQRSPFADAYVAQMAGGLTEAMGLGKDDVPDLLGVSFSTPDLVGHGFGPNSQEIHDVYLRLDLTIGALLERLDTLVGAGRYVVALSADHGVTEIPEQLKAKGADGGRIDVVGMSQAIEEAASEKLGKGPFIARLNSNDVYFAPGKFDALTKNPAALNDVLKAITAREGVLRAFPADEVRGAASDPDPIKRAAALSYVPGRSGDIIIALKPGWMGAANGTTHGSANPDDQHVPLLLYGSGIKAGTYANAVTPADIAPTLASLVGVRLPSADGHALNVALTTTATTTAAR